MKVIEQLVQHFHARGALTAAEIEYLIQHGYVRRQDLYRQFDTDDEPAEPTPLWEPEQDDKLDRLGEEMSGAATGRKGGGKKKSGKDKAKPTGHDLTPLAAVLSSHLSDRQQYPALVELGQRLTPGVRGWEAAAAAVADASPTNLETALVAALNHRPPALGELWCWCETAGLFEWAEHEDHTGPVADALAALLTADVPTQVGRLHQLKKLPQVAGLLELLRARRAILAALPALYDRHFSRLKVWLVNPDPTGPAGAVWPALPWAFVLRYNVGTDIPPGYLVAFSNLRKGLQPLAWETAWRMAGPLLIGLIPLRATPPPKIAEDGWLSTLDRPFKCPFDWAV